MDEEKHRMPPKKRNVYSRVHFFLLTDLVERESKYNSNRSGLGNHFEDAFRCLDFIELLVAGKRTASACLNVHIMLPSGHSDNKLLCVIGMRVGERRVHGGILVHQMGGQEPFPGQAKFCHVKVNSIGLMFCSNEYTKTRDLSECHLYTA